MKHTIKHSPQVRKIPYPYTSMLAICSDLDETPDFETYYETVRFLNTESSTRHGKGVGLEVGNTIYFDMPDNQFSYNNATSSQQKVLHQLIRYGYIDCLHSFGDLCNERKKIQSYLQILTSEGCAIKTWIDHAIAPSNIDSDIMKGRGADPDSDAYCLDLLREYGIRYYWLGRVTSVIAQNTRKTFKGIADYRHPLSSIKTIVKEYLKGFFAKHNVLKKYNMNYRNNVMRPREVGGFELIEFMRSNPSYCGVSCLETGDGIAKVITEKYLKLINEVYGISILYTHLGKLKSHGHVFSPRAVRSFQLLKQYFKNRQTLVTTTTRLLDYLYMLDNILVVTTSSDSKQIVNVRTLDDSVILDGLTIYVNTTDIELYINGHRVENYISNERDETGNYSISIEWMPLIYPTWL